MEAKCHCWKTNPILFLSLILSQSLAYTSKEPRHALVLPSEQRIIRLAGREGAQDRNTIYLTSRSNLQSKSSLSVTEYDDFLPTPHPDLDAPGVVHTCMTALVEGKENAGLEVCFSFSSDRCRVRRSTRPMGYGPRFATSVVRSLFVLSLVTGRTRWVTGTISATRPQPRLRVLGPLRRVADAVNRPCDQWNGHPGCDANRPHGGQQKGWEPQVPNLFVDAATRAPTPPARMLDHPRGALREKRLRSNALSHVALPLCVYNMSCPP